MDILFLEIPELKESLLKTDHLLEQVMVAAGASPSFLLHLPSLSNHFGAAKRYYEFLALEALKQAQMNIFDKCKIQLKHQPESEVLLESAIRSNNLDIVKTIWDSIPPAESKYLLDGVMLSIASQYATLDILRFLKSVGMAFEHPSSTSGVAWRKEEDKATLASILQFIYVECGCQVSDVDLRIRTNAPNLDVLEYLHKKFGKSEEDFNDCLHRRVSVESLERLVSRKAKIEFKKLVEQRHLLTSKIIAFALSEASDVSIDEGISLYRESFKLQEEQRFSLNVNVDYVPSIGSVVSELVALGTPVSVKKYLPELILDNRFRVVSDFMAKEGNAIEYSDIFPRILGLIKAQISGISCCCFEFLFTTARLVIPLDDFIAICTDPSQYVFASMLISLRIHADKAEVIDALLEPGVSFVLEEAIRQGYRINPSVGGSSFFSSVIRRKDPHLIDIIIQAGMRPTMEEAERCVELVPDTGRTIAAICPEFRGKLFIEIPDGNFTFPIFRKEIDLFAAEACDQFDKAKSMLALNRGVELFGNEERVIEKMVEDHGDEASEFVMEALRLHYKISADIFNKIRPCQRAEVVKKMIQEHLGIDPNSYKFKFTYAKSGPPPPSSYLSLVLSFSPSLPHVAAPSRKQTTHDASESLLLPRLPSPLERWIIVLDSGDPFLLYH